MRRAQGYAIVTQPGLPDRECDTFSCCHCNKVVFVPSKADPSALGGFCTQCMKHICSACADLGQCTPLMKRIEAAEARGRMFKALGI